MYAIEFLEIVVTSVEDVVSACFYGNFPHHVETSRAASVKLRGKNYME